MKLKKWICAILILQCLLVLLIYWAADTVVTDKTAPKIHIEGTVAQVSVHDPESALLQGVTASDETDGDVTDSLVVESIRLTDPNGTVTVTYAAFDGAGNVTKAERTLRYSDYVSPRFRLSAPLVLDLNYYSDLRGRIRVEDVLDGDISHRIHVENLTGSSAQVVGTYTVRLWITNSLGDTVQLELPVEVCASGSYSGYLQLTDYLVYLPVGAEFSPESYLLGYSAGGSATDLTAGVPEDCTLEIIGSVDSRTPGVYEVCYRLNRGTDTGYTKLMVVVEG